MGYIKEGKYLEDRVVACYEVDASMGLKPAAFMDMAQEAAYLAATAFHFGYDEMAAEGKAWVLSRLHFHFDKCPKWRDRLTLSTWHKGPSGPFYMRDFRMESPEGESLVRCTSAWIVLDVKERRMCRTTEVMENVPESSLCKDNAIAESIGKIAMPRGVEAVKVGSHKVEYSDVDLLGHTNNARYMVWAMDSMPFEKASRPVKDVKIAFNHETLAGETVELYLVETEGNGVSMAYVEGKVGERSAFCTQIEFAL